MAEIITVVSGKGGTGKTTVSLNLGTRLARVGFKVLLVDLDLGLRNLDLCMHTEDRIISNLTDVISGREELNEVIVKGSEKTPVDLLPAPQTKDNRSISPSDIRELLESAKKYYDYIIVDGAPGITEGFENAISHADRAIVVMTQDPIAVRDADRVVRLLQKQGFLDKIFLIINHVDMELIEQKSCNSLDMIKEMLPYPILSMIPSDKRVRAAINNGTALEDPEVTASIAFDNLASRLRGKDLPFCDFTEKKETPKRRFGFRRS